jgi:hypothetical protein
MVAELEELPTHHDPSIGINLGRKRFGEGKSFVTIP